jgi:GNAT superfamily N-acetyltransferase
MLLTTPPARGEAERWIRRFSAAFPEASHVAIGIDRPPTGTDALAELVGHRLRLDVNVVLSTPRLRTPARAAPPAVFRKVESDRDWRQAIELSLAADEEREEPAGYRAYVDRRMGAIRRVCEAGHGSWFGAFRDGEMHSGLGIFGAGSGLARFQAVDTHPEHRRQGLATHLLLAAGEYARSSLRARTLVIAADPGGHAIGIYRSLGFVERERQVQLERVVQG